MHTHFISGQEKITEIKVNHKNLLELVNKNPMVFNKYLKTPEQEYIEAVGLYSIVNDEDILGPEDYGVDSVNYLLGLADIIGELRRFILDSMRRDQYQKLDNILEKMEEIYTYLFALDYPKGLTYDLRRKTDVGRGIIEKTRGDITLSNQINRLNQNLKKE